LVNTMTEIRSQRRPTRPDWKNHTRPDVTLSAALVLDQSGSMARLTRNAALGAFARGDALTPLGCPTLIIGPRDERRYGYGSEVSPNAHRHRPVHIDIFKDWGEDMGAAQERIPSVRATGGTPLSDGIQMALLELQERTENHRVIFVLTDGEPNCPRVVNRQIRLAREAGIHVVGVGIGNGARAVKTQFPDAYVSVPNISGLAPALVNVLLGLIFPKNASTKKNFSWG
jgi:nitric oxide reductase activation protein